MIEDEKIRGFMGRLLFCHQKLDVLERAHGPMQGLHVRIILPLPWE